MGRRGHGHWGRNRVPPLVAEGWGRKPFERLAWGEGCHLSSLCSPGSFWDFCLNSQDLVLGTGLWKAAEGRMERPEEAPPLLTVLPLSQAGTVRGQPCHWPWEDCRSLRLLQMRVHSFRLIPPGFSPTVGAPLVDKAACFLLSEDSAGSLLREDTGQHSLPSLFFLNLN